MEMIDQNLNCRCDQDAGVDASLTEANPNKVFFHCRKERTNQCMFFRWAGKQPEYHDPGTRNRSTRVEMGQPLRLVKTCYGLLDGPRAWFKRLRKVMIEELGYRQRLADPCVYFLHDETKVGWERLQGNVAIATDDMIHGKGPEVPIWPASLCREAVFATRGRRHHRGLGALCPGIRKIDISRIRKCQRYSLCITEEIAQLWSAIGALAWLAKEPRPHLSGPRPRVRDIMPTTRESPGWDQDFGHCCGQQAPTEFGDGCLMG